MSGRRETYSILSSVRICVRCHPSVSVTIILLYVLQGFTPILLTLSSGAVIDASIRLLGSQDYRPLFSSLSVLLLAVSYDWVSNQLTGLLRLRLQIAVRTKFCPRIVEHISRLNYRYVEDPGTWDLISRVAGHTDESILHAFDSLLSFLSLIQKTAGLFLILLFYAPLSSVGVIVCSLPLTWLSLQGGKASYAGICETQEYRRRYEALSGLLTSRKTAAERTLFGYQLYINKAWEHAYRKWRTVNEGVNIRHFIKAKAGSICLVWIAVFVMLLLIPEAVGGEVPPGLFMALLSNFFALVQLMSWSLAASVSEIAGYHAFFDDMGVLFGLELSERGEISARPEEFLSLEFRNVSFTYPGTSKKVLDGLSFCITRGQSYSFVGANGCGKTTITKLITGLYDDYEGEIFINGVNIREWNHGRIASFFSVVYQDFARYGLSLYENIAVGDDGYLAGKDIGQNDFQEVMHALKLDRAACMLHYGVQTGLGKMKRGSEDLSGGQWQRVAIARGLIGKRPVKILDEPTAALDPLAESALYEMFQEISRKSTTITISHRLASARQTDIIFVIDKGRVCGQGSHEFLYENNSLYRQMYDSQRSWYSA